MNVIAAERPEWDAFARNIRLTDPTVGADIPGTRKPRRRSTDRGKVAPLPNLSTIDNLVLQVELAGPDGATGVEVARLLGWTDGKGTATASRARKQGRILEAAGEDGAPVRRDGYQVYLAAPEDD